MLCMCSSAVLIASISSVEYQKLFASDFAGRSMKRTSVLWEKCTRTARTKASVLWENRTALQKLLRLLGKSTMRLCVLGKSTTRSVVVLLRSISSLDMLLLLSFDRLRRCLSKSKSAKSSLDRRLVTGPDLSVLSLLLNKP